MTKGNCHTSVPEKWAEDPGRYMGKREAAAYTGLSKRTLEAHPEIPRFRVGGKVLYRKSDLDRWIEGHAVAALPAESPHSLRSMLKRVKENVMRAENGREAKWQTRD